MRYIVLTDNKIDKDDAQRVKKKIKDFFERNGVTTKIDLFFEDMTDLPFENYYSDNSGQNRGIRKSYIKKRAKAIKDRYHKKYDSIVFWVHHNNWVPVEDNIWGWNISNEFSGFENQQCRFDPKNDANTLGTFYHESMHAYDQYIFRILGKSINEIAKVSDWDDRVVHGGSPRYQYIRHKENNDILKKIAPLINKATQQRVNDFQQFKSLLKSLIETYRSLINALTRKDQS